MKYQELTTKKKEELYEHLLVFKKELVGLRIKKSMMQLKTTHLIRKNKKSVARIMTCLAYIKNKKGGTC